MDTTTITLETTRLRLTPLSLDYHSNLSKEFAPEITAHLNHNPKDIKSSIAASREQMKKGENMQFVVLDKKTGDFLGHLALLHIRTSEPEIGIWLKKSARGHKNGKEAVRAIKNWADEHLEYDHIKYQVEKTNIPSRKIAEMLGGKVGREGITRNKKGESLEEVEYWIPKEQKC